MRAAFRARGMWAMLGFWLAYILDVPKKVLAQGGIQDLFNNSQQAAQQLSTQFDDIWNNHFSTYLEIPRTISIVIAVGCICWLFITLMLEHSHYGDVDWTKLTLPILICYVLVTPNMVVDCCLAIRNVTNTVNAQALQETQLNVIYSAHQGNAALRSIVFASRDRCDDLSPTERTKCIQEELVNIEAAIKAQEDQHGPLEWIQDWWDRYNGLAIKLAETGDLLSDPLWLAAAPVWESILFSVLNDISTAIYLSMEVAMMLTSILLPFSLALALGPMEFQPIYAWLTSMIGIGMWKVMFTLCAGIGAQLVNTNLITFSNGLGWFIAIFSPFLSLGLVAGGGFAIYQGILTLGASAARASLRLL